MRNSHNQIPSCVHPALRSDCAPNCSHNQEQPKIPQDAFLLASPEIVGMYGMSMYVDDVYGSCCHVAQSKARLDLQIFTPLVMRIVNHNSLCSLGRNKSKRHPQNPQLRITHFQRNRSLNETMTYHDPVSSYFIVFLCHFQHFTHLCKDIEQSLNSVTRAMTLSSHQGGRTFRNNLAMFERGVLVGEASERNMQMLTMQISNILVVSKAKSFRCMSTRHFDTVQLPSCRTG